MKTANFGPFIFNHLECDSHQKVNHFQGGILLLSNIDFAAKVHRLVFEMSCVEKLIIRIETDRHTESLTQPST